MPFFMWPPIVDGEASSVALSAMFNHFSAHILLHQTHLYVRRPQMNIFSCGWARAGAFPLGLWLCAGGRTVCLCASAPHIHNINFTLKTLFYRHSQRFSWFSLAHATTIWFSRKPSRAVVVFVLLHTYTTTTLLISFMFVYH